MPNSSNKTTLKVMDVASPGSTKPSDFSKNVIIKSKPILKDPMLNENTSGQLDGLATDPAEPIGPPELPKTLSRKLNIEPLRDNLKEDKDTVDPDETKSATINSSKKDLDTKVSSNQERLDTSSEAKDDLDVKNSTEYQSTLEAKDDQADYKSDQSKLDSDSSVATLSLGSTPKDDLKASNSENDVTNSHIESSPQDSLINKKQVNEISDAKLVQLEEQKEQEKDQEINHMIESKQYFLPFNKTQKRKSKRFVTAGIIISIILIILWAYVALSNGLIKL